ncbi:MAG: abortive infection family protein [Ignavibacteriaceae bacterium]
MNNLISPAYQMQLIEKIEKEIWAKFSSPINIRFYIDKWYVSDNGGYNYYENFNIAEKENGDINLTKTLHNIDGETLLKIAIDLGIETPNFIPSIPIFRNDIKSSYETASLTFETAFRQIEEHPDIAIGLANSSLESILKEILKNESISIKQNTNKTLYELTTDILKAFQLYPNSEMPVEIKTIGSSLISVAQSIEKLRSGKTNFHGKAPDEYIINDSLYTYFAFNSIVTIGLFLDAYYKKKFPEDNSTKQEETENDDLPF